MAISLLEINPVIRISLRQSVFQFALFVSDIISFFTLNLNTVD